MFEEGSEEIDQVIDVTLSRILSKRTPANPLVILETKIAIFSELFNKTSSKHFHHLLDKNIEEYIKATKLTG
jgi:carbamate kinase